MGMTWRKQLKANKHWVFTVSENCLGHLLICDLCFSRTGCSTPRMRGLTALELQLGNASGKTEDVLEEDSVVSLAWQVCVDLGLFFSIKMRNWLYYLERGIPWKTCALLTRHVRDVLLLWPQKKQTASLSKKLQLSWAGCAPSGLTVSLLLVVSAAPPSVLLLRYLFPFLYIGLWWSVGLRISPQLPNFYNILGGKRFSLGVKQGDISTDFCTVFDFGVCSAFYVSPFAIPHPLWTIEQDGKRGIMEDNWIKTSIWL